MSRGNFHKMDPAQLREIARKGGIAAQRTGRAHRFASGEDAREAGRKGGLARGRARRAARIVDDVQAAIVEEVDKIL